MYINAFVSQASVLKSVLHAMFFCAEMEVADSKSFLARRRAEMRVEKSFEEMRKVDQCSDESS